MPRLRCPDCAFRFRPDPEDEDRRTVRCPECGARVENDDEFEPRRKRRPRTNPMRVLLVVLGVMGFLGLLLCGGLIGIGWWAIKPTSFPEETVDYAEARKAFKTTLTTQDEAPQDWDDETPPPGVAEIDYKSGSLTLKAWVNKPAAGEKAKPAVVYLHGGFAFGEEDWDQCEPFRTAGFVTLVPMLRGENGMPGSYSMFYDEVDDAVAASEALKAIPGVDRNRVFVCGHSAGGTVSMLAAMASKNFKACASFSGSPDQVAFVRTQPELVPFDIDDQEELRMRSPLAFPKSFKCPARLYYGDGEIEFKFSTERLAEKSQAAGLDVQAVEVPGDHFDMVDPAMRQAVTFFKSR